MGVAGSADDVLEPTEEADGQGYESSSCGSSMSSMATVLLNLWEKWGCLRLLTGKGKEKG